MIRPMVRVLTAVAFFVPFLAISAQMNRGPETPVFPSDSQPNSCEPDDPLLARSDALYRAGHPAAALRLLDERLREENPHGAVLWRAGRAALALGWIDPNPSTSIPQYVEAQVFGRRAVRALPECTEPRFLLAAALGRHAVVDQNVRVIAPLAKELHGEVERLLMIDPEHPGGHNILGKLHFEMMKTNWFVRQIGIRLVGGAGGFEPGWDAAELHLRRAVELEPRMVVHRLELGRLLHRRREPGARAELEAARDLPLFHPQDALLREEAIRLLADL